MPVVVLMYPMKATGAASSTSARARMPASWSSVMPPVPVKPRKFGSTTPAVFSSPKRLSCGRTRMSYAPRQWASTWLVTCTRAASATAPAAIATAAASTVASSIGRWRASRTHGGGRPRPITFVERLRATSSLGGIGLSELQQRPPPVSVA
jgi:hypothetical protein